MPLNYCLRENPCDFFKNPVWRPIILCGKNSKDLVLLSSAVFKFIQTESSQNKNFLSFCCRSYASYLRKASLNEPQNYICEMLKLLSFVFDMFELFFIQDEKTFLSDLLSILDHHFVETIDINNMTYTEHSTNAAYWKAVFSCLLYGKYEEFQRLIALSLPYFDNPKLPEIFQKFTEKTYDQAFPHELFDWNDIESSNNDMRNIIRIIKRDSSVFAELKSYFPNWLCYAASLCLFNNPMATSADLNEFGDDRDDNIMSCIVKPILSKNFFAFIDEFHKHIPDSFAVTHLTDLYFHTGKLRTEKYGIASTQFREYMILDYANFIPLDVAQIYYMSCGSFGRDCFTYRLDCSDPQCNNEALALIELCIENSFDYTGICIKMVQRYLDDNDPKALLWALFSGKNQLSKVVLDHFVSECVRDFSFIDIVPDEFIYSRYDLTFIKRFSMYIKNCHRFEDFEQKGLALSNLIENGDYVHPRCVCLILDEIRSVLESGKLKNKRTLNCFQRFLNGLEIEHKADVAKLRILNRLCVIQTTFE